MNKFYRQLFIICVAICTPAIYAFAQITTITNTSSTSWVCPPGVTTVTVQCWGGGGSGGGTTLGTQYGGGGGAGGAYAQKTLTVTPGTSYSVNVGATRTGTAAAGAQGNPSWFNTVGTVFAEGGAGGAAPNTGVAAGGIGSSASSIGDFVFAGGNGGDGSGLGGTSGGGGGGAGSTAVGGNAAAGTAGSGGDFGGGDGATGRTTGGNGAAGNTYGGGGAGGFVNNNTDRNGGNGAAGAVILRYATPDNITPFSDLTFCTSSYPTAYQTVSFTLKERLATDFTRNQTAQTLILSLPTGFEFNTSAGHSVSETGTDITSIGITSVTTTAITVTVTTSAANPNTSFDEIVFNNFQIRATATGYGDLLRNGGTFQMVGSTQQPLSSESFGFMFSGATSVYNNSDVGQYTTADINRNCESSRDAAILRIRVNVTGGCPPPTITQFNFNTTGDVGYSQNPGTNITSAKIYYNEQLSSLPLITSSTPVFGTVSSPNGAFTINGSQKLEVGSGDYYFFLVYDVPTGANAGDRLDASMTSFVMDGNTISNMGTPNPTGTRLITNTTCLTPDIPNPTSNIETIPANSYVIPMDNTNQAVVAPFNMKAYGLVHSLLMNDIPVKWVIKAGKAKDAADFTATAARVLPTAVAAASVTFKASAFIIEEQWLNTPYYASGQTALQVISTYTAQGAGYNQVAIFQLSNNENLDVRYTLDQRPKIAIFSNGGYDSIQEKYLNEAGITNYFVQSAGNFTGLAECYTFCSEGHWDFSSNPDINPVDNVIKFVNEGGNFLAQCAGIDLYENHQPSGGHFQTSDGINYDANSITITNPTSFPNPDMAFSQFEGTVTNENGTIERYWLKPTSAFNSETYSTLTDAAQTTTVTASAAHLAPQDSVGGNVFYLGGHNYWVGGISFYNGRRMYLNATLIPAARPTAFTLDPGANVTICAGQSTTLGGNPTGGSASTNYIWSPSTGLNNTTSANPVASPTVTTVYTVIANDNGCPGGPNSVTVTVNPTPAAPSPAGSNSPVCSGSTLSLTATNIASATYSWTGPNSFTSTSEDPTIPNVTTAAAGTYTVVALLGTCQGPATTTSVTINASPAAPTAGSNSTVCSGNTLSLTASTVGSSTYAWTGPNSFTSTSQNPTITNVTTAASGTYSVAATEGGCTGATGTVSVTIQQTPGAPTAGSNGPICSGSDLSLTASTITGATYAWTGPNSFTSTSQNPVISAATTAASGTYSVTATVGGCPGTSGTISVTVNAPPIAPTAGSNSPICSGDDLSLTASSTGTSYNWSGPNSFTSTSQNPVISGATTAYAGTYSVTATTGSCTGPAGTVAVTINPIPLAPTATNNSPICSGGTLSLTASSTGTSYNWSGPNSFSSTSQNPTIAGVTTAASGTYSVTATASGCTGPAGTTTVSITQTPAAPIAGSNSPICVGVTLSLTASSTGTSYNWSGPNSFTSTSQNPTIAGATTAESGTYSVTATTSGCTGSAGTVSVTVSPPPAAPTAGSNSPVCSGNTLSLTASVITGATYNWSGPNSFTSTSQNPTIASVTTAGGGTYSVTATVAGCTGSAGTTSVTINAAPANPTAGSNSPVCSGNTLSLTSSTVPGASGYSWSGPNSFSSATQNPTIASVTTLASGTYTVTATVPGCSNVSGTTSVTINETPASPTANNSGPICTGSNLSLSASSTGTSYNWSGPNSFTSTSQNPVISPATTAAGGTYTVTATSNGCTSTPRTTTAVVHPFPAQPSSASGSPNPICSGLDLSLTAATNGAATYNWNGPNGYSATGQDQVITAITTAGAGTYSVSYTINGCTGPATTFSVTVYQTPAAPTAGSNGPICAGNTLSLTASSAGTSYSWTGPNSFTSTSQNPTIPAATTAATGTYSVTATANGCTGPAGTVSVTINPPPAPPTAGNNSPICSGSTLSLTASTVTGASYAWSGPNSFSSTSQNPTIAGVTTAATGTYSVIATVAGCPPLTTVTTSVTINQTPGAPTAGSNTPVCVGGNLSLTASGSGTSYTWTGPNSFSSATQNPVINGVGTTDAGTYSVTTTSATGCTSVNSTATVVINPPPAAPTLGSNTPVCSGNTLSLTANTVASATYSWTGPNSFSSSSQNPTIGSVTTLANGTYSATVTVPGCATSPVGTTSVTIFQTPAAPTAGNNSPICIGTTLSLTASTIGSSTYSWSGPDGFTSTSQNPSIGSATSLATGTYSVTATENGCTGPAGTTSVTVSPPPATPTAGSNSPVCVANTLSLTASTVTGATYSWSGPNGYTSSSQNPTIAGVSSNEAGTYSVTATIAGCTGAAGTVSVTINPPPAAPTAGSNGPICSGNTLSLTASTITGASTYNWTGPNSFTSSTQDPTIGSVTTLATGNYSVTATVPGCPLSPAGTISVTVNQTPAAPTAGSNSPACVGGDISLTASGSGTSYAWSGPNSFSSTSQNPVINGVSTAEAGTYTVNTTSAAGCTSSNTTTSVTVNPPPAAPSAGSNSATICSGSTLSLTASTITGATVYTWNGPNSFTSTSQNPTIGSITTLGNGTYSVTAFVPGCALSAAGTVSVTVFQTPAAPTATNNGPICSGSDISLTASTVGGSTYSWTGPNSFSSTTQDPVITGATTANTGLYSVTATENGCTGPAGTTSVTVNSIPAAPTAGSNSPLCTGATLSLTANTISGATYAWSGPNSFSSAAQNPTITNITTADAGTYSVSATVLGCTGAFGTVSVTIAPPPAAPTAGSNAPICSGTTLSLTASTVTGASSYNWSGPNGFTSSTQDPTIGSVTTLATGTYSVSATVNGCTGPAGTTSVTIDQTPSAPIATNNGPLCIGDNLTLSASTISGATYAWTGPNSFSSSSQDATIAGVATSDAGTYSVTATVNGCTSPAGTTAVIVAPPPSTPTAGSNSPVCSGQTLSLTANTISGATYNWSGPNSFSSASQNPAIASVTTLASGTYSVFVTIGSCTSPTGTVAVTIDQTPASPTASNSSPICSGTDLSLTASTVGGSTYAWSGPNGFSSTTQDPVIVAATTADAGTYSVTATENGCTSPVATTSVIINPIPAAPTAGNNGPLCVGDNLTLTANTVSGATYAWTGPNGFTSASQNPTIAAVTTTEAGTYSVSVTVSGCQGPDGTTTLIVAPPPAAPTAGSNSPVCSGTDISLTANTISGATYSWTGPNAFTSSSQNPVITPATTADDGNYSVTVQIGSCISSAGTVSVTVNQSPVAPTAGSNSPVCAGSDLSLTASTITGVTYSWNGPNGFTSTTQDPIITGVTTAESGTYSVTVISTTNSCPSTTSTVSVVISNPATANAGADQTVCANNASPLNGVITGGAGTGNWSTPNGVGIFTPATTALNATYTPNINDTLAGDILLILTSTNNGGCTAAKDTMIMHVNRGPIVNAGVDQSICSNNYAVVEISGTIQFAAGGDWTTLGTGSFVTTSTVLTNTYVPTPADVANGSVVLVLTSTGNGVCNAVTDSVLITFTPAPVVNAGSNIPVCFGNVTAQLNGSVSGGASTGIWTTLGTGSFTPSATTLNAVYNLSNADTTAGSVTLILTSTNNGNCVAETGTVVITMTPAPIVAAGSDVTLCANNDTVTLSGSISGGTTTGYWSSNGTGVFLPDSSILNGNYIPSAADTAAGSIMLTLTSTNGCREVKDSLLVTITDAPVVNAGPDMAICGGNPVALNGYVSAVATGGQWTTSGNGTFSPDDITLNATYVLGSNDTAGVTLVLTSTGNGQCLAVTDTMIISVGDKPVAGFSNTQACTGQLITFTDSSYATGVNDSIVSWNWTIAGANDTLQNPTHTYTASGTDTVTLIVTTNTGCTDTVMHVVNINPSPVAAFTYTVDCVVDSVYFTSTSTIPSGNIVSWNWNLGDGTTSTQQNPVHNYTTAGTYTVVLTVTSDSGCTSIFSDTVQSCNMVQAGFTSTSSACSGQAIAFTDTSMIVGTDSIATWSWNFGDGGTDTLQNPSHTYASSGTFTVSLVVVTNSGATDTAMQTILINPAPVASFTVLSTCALDSVYFTDISTITGGNIISWNWNFGDGKTDTVQNPVHYYDSTAAYVVSLTVTSDSGCTTTFTDTVVHAKDITASFADSAYCPFNVQFTDTSLIASSDSIISWNWNFGDGTTDTVQNPAHSYTAAGTYTVQLVMTSSGGCTDTATQTIIVVPLPIADFVPAGGNYYKGEQINFTDLSANAASWMWDFGDGTSDSIQNPSHIYEQTGLLTVQLIVMNSLGCADTATNSFVIYPNNVGVPTAFTPNGDGLNDVLHVKGGPMKEMDWRIYNEWGNEVFHSTDQSVGWDATYKGKMQPATRYVYTLKGTTISGDIIDINGEVTIVR